MSRDPLWMTSGRVILVVTLAAVTALGTWFAVVEWNEANKIAAVASALGAVAAVGVAAWAALRQSVSPESIVVSDTGDATAEGAGGANSGVQGKTGQVGSLQVRNTGNAKSGHGNANTGIQFE